MERNCGLFMFEHKIIILRHCYEIRNYVMHPYKLVKDVRTGYESSNVEGVMNGEIDDFLKAFLMMMGQKNED